MKLVDSSQTNQLALLLFAERIGIILLCLGNVLWTLSFTVFNNKIYVSDVKDRLNRIRQDRAKDWHILLICLENVWLTLSFTVFNDKSKSDVKDRFNRIDPDRVNKTKNIFE